MSKVSQDKKPVRASVDGMIRSPEKEKELNALAADAFASGAGKQFLDYLKQLTGGAFDQSVSNDVLRHAAGQRWLVAVIDQRIARGIADRKGSK